MLNTIVTEKEVESYDKDLTISALEGTVSDQAATIKAMQRKFHAIMVQQQNLTNNNTAAICIFRFPSRRCSWNKYR